MLTATSANRSGSPALTTADDVERALGLSVALIIDGGPSPGGLASTIVDVDERRPTAHPARAGGLRPRVRIPAINGLDLRHIGRTHLPMTQSMAGRQERRGRQRAALVGLATGVVTRAAADHSLEELDGLARAAGADVVLRLVQERPAPDPALYLGRGKVGMLKQACAELDVDLIIVDNELSPAQLRNLEKETGLAVLDRTQLILDIFARRARTREGQLQVELAQLKYLMPRLVGSGDWLSRLGGGIGTRGPGETKLETDRRHIRHRLSVIGKQIADVKARRAQLRDRRREGLLPTVALVGYTNAGKTTLFNRLARQEALVSDALFVTLDPLLRQVRLDGGPQILLSDTVGFIDRLPHSLVAAFRATLEEVVQADLLLHVVDAVRSRSRAAHRSGRARADRDRGARGAAAPRLQQGRSDLRRRAGPPRGRTPTARSSCPPPPAPASRRWSAR